MNETKLLNRNGPLFQKREKTYILLISWAASFGDFMLALQTFLIKTRPKFNRHTVYRTSKITKHQHMRTVPLPRPSWWPKAIVSLYEASAQTLAAFTYGFLSVLLIWIRIPVVSKKTETHRAEKQSRNHAVFGFTDDVLCWSKTHHHKHYQWI